ncbi:MAG: OmpH family outer membrane protein [Bacteroidaceae bacterium]|nr:OmpH family outer membrane protein [Bacteroidaceae bacterium]
MKRILLSIVLMLPLTMLAQSQVVRFGYLSYNAVFEQMPEYKQSQKDFAALKEKYDAEATRAENEFQRKFAEFLQGQKDFPASIMQKRQAELQELMDKSINFRQKSRGLLRQAEKDMQQPIKSRLEEAIKAVGSELGLIFILNTDGNSCPYVQPEAGVDVTGPVLTKLGLQAAPSESGTN